MYNDHITITIFKYDSDFGCYAPQLGTLPKMPLFASDSILRRRAGRVSVDFIWLRLRDLRGLCGGLGTMENCCSIESPQPMCSALSSTTSFQQRAEMPVTAKNRKVMKLGTRIKSVQISMVALISQSLTSFGLTLAKNDVTNMRQNVM
mmetsp:Transcript_31046/g.64034  ORF Transcript_31046/g.64034 Transcript_31046/m.64034 type:complete len:148 (-) Transcript_31046:142-585(-)